MINWVDSTEPSNPSAGNQFRTLEQSSAKTDKHFWWFWCEMWRLFLEAAGSKAAILPVAGLQRLLDGLHGRLDVLLVKGHGGLHDQDAAVAQSVVHAVLPPEHTTGRLGPQNQHTATQTGPEPVLGQNQFWWRGGTSKELVWFQPGEERKEMTGHKEGWKEGRKEGMEERRNVQGSKEEKKIKDRQQRTEGRKIQFRKDTRKGNKDK